MKRSMLQSLAALLLGVSLAVGVNAWATNPLACDWTTNEAHLTGTWAEHGNCLSNWRVHFAFEGGFTTGAIGKRTTPTFMCTTEKSMGGSWPSVYSSTGADKLNAEGFACGYTGANFSLSVASDQLAASTACPLSTSGTYRSRVSITQGGVTYTTDSASFTI